MKDIIKILLGLILLLILFSGCTIYILDCPCEKEKDYKRDKDGEYYPDFVKTLTVKEALLLPMGEKNGRRTWRDKDGLIIEDLNIPIVVDTTLNHWIDLDNIIRRAKAKTDRELKPEIDELLRVDIK